MADLARVKVPDGRGVGKHAGLVLVLIRSGAAHNCIRLVQVCPLHVAGNHEGVGEEEFIPERGLNTLSWPPRRVKGCHSCNSLSHFIAFCGGEVRSGAQLRGFATLALHALSAVFGLCHHLTCLSTASPNLKSQRSLSARRCQPDSQCRLPQSCCYADKYCPVPHHLSATPALGHDGTSPRTARLQPRPCSRTPQVHTPTPLVVQAAVWTHLARSRSELGPMSPASRSRRRGPSSARVVKLRGAPPGQPT